MHHRFTVCIRCSTYNHQDFIKMALDGFVMQETSFPFVISVLDDASTDGTPRVLRDYYDKYFDTQDSEVAFQEEHDYGTLLFARHSVNKNCFVAIVLLKENHYSQRKTKRPYLQRWMEESKYIAYCEGDDFWTEPTKLQKQVDFLESNPDYVMCFHKVNVLCDDKENWIFSDLKAGDYSARDIYDNWVVPTCSVMYLYAAKPVFESNRDVVFNDIFMWLQLAEKGRLYCLDFIGATYRRHAGSFSCGYSVETCIRLYRQYRFFEKRFPSLKDISRRKQETQGLRGIIYAPYFPGIWKYRVLYMIRHPKLFFSSFFTNTILSYTPFRTIWRWIKKR